MSKNAKGCFLRPASFALACAANPPDCTFVLMSLVGKCTGSVEMVEMAAQSLGGLGKTG